MAFVLSAKDRPVFWAWVAWKDACRNAAKAGRPLPPRPRVVTVYIQSHRGGIPASWWSRYALHVGKVPLPKPKPPVPPDVVPWIGLAALIQRGVFAAEDPLKAIGLPPGSFVYLSCDTHPSYAQWLTESTVAALRSAQLAVSCWGNQNQIGVERIRQVHRNLRLDGEPIFQFETADEAATLLAADARLGVGNGNNITAEQKAEMNRRINDGVLACSHEVYPNVTGGPMPDQATAGGLNVASLTIGNYDGSSENPGVGRYISGPEYRTRCKPEVWLNICSYHVAGNRDGWGWFPRGPGA